MAMNPIRVAERNLRQCQRRVLQQQGVVDRLRLHGDPAPEALDLLEEYKAALEAAADTLEFTLTLDNV